MSLSFSDVVNIVLGLLAMTGAWIGAYVAIRSDLARLHERVEASIGAAVRAHERIDDLVRIKHFDRRLPVD